MAFDTASGRRRFYLERGLRRAPVGSGSDLSFLMDSPRDPIEHRPEALFGDIFAVVVGGVATRAFAPERATKDLDFLIDHDRFEEACERLVSAGWGESQKLLFPNASLGLYRKSWVRSADTIDIIASAQPWAAMAIRNPVQDQTGLTVIDLPYLVLMKLDSARGIDQGDLTRMLGRVDQLMLDRVVEIVDRYTHDPQAAEDVRQYATLGRMEYERDPRR